MEDDSINNRLKVDSTITNANAFLAVQKEFGSFQKYIWQFVGGKPIQNKIPWHPVDAHTLMPFLHWLPKKIHRILLKKLKLDFYADEKYLNLLDKNALKSLCTELGIENVMIKEIRTFDFVSNPILIAKK